MKNQNVSKLYSPILKSISFSIFEELPFWVLNNLLASEDVFGRGNDFQQCVTT